MRTAAENVLQLILPLSGSALFLKFICLNLLSICLHVCYWWVCVLMLLFDSVVLVILVSVSTHVQR